jgi:glycosyltransferase involved in cell wall biosynthesis
MRAALAFIIPVYNVAADISATLTQLTVIRQLRYEIIVSDNGSSDDTVANARAAGAKVVMKPTDVRGTAGECCNRSAAATTAEVLWFIEVGVIVPELEAFADEVVSCFRAHPRTVAIVPRLVSATAHPTWAETMHYGYHSLVQLMQNRVLKTGAGSSACLIISRRWFEKVHGFNPAAVTGVADDLLRRLAYLGDIQVLWHRRALVPHRLS